ncbi:LytR C-terminal domain-containing protein [Phenylobacterium sp.]|uniref:LytR C-terminal domain-containing protein n=1 Tax=Phenylobacterium sp. TaxID=1871053 RepID=UPI002F4073DC
MTLPRLIRPILAAPLLLALAACALVPDRARWVDVRPVEIGDAKVAVADRGYEAAAAAIDRGDYADALDQLQAARAHAAADIRILNAFGVVYDKLGRFDLSARYYAEAKAVDPGSAIVNNNIAFSAALQQGAAAMAAMAEAPAQSAPPAAAQEQEQAAARPRPDGAVLFIRAPAQLALAKPLPITTGHILVVVNASGRSGGADAVRTELARLGWSAPRAALRNAPREPETTIRYSKDAVVAARALARTLPRSTRMVACDGACKGIRLVIGADAGAWRTRGRFSRS